MAGHTSTVRARADQKVHEAGERAGASVTRARHAVNRAKRNARIPIQKAVDETVGPVVRQGTKKGKPYRWQAVAVGVILMVLLVAARRRSSKGSEAS